jgi:hypothetical protein
MLEEEALSCRCSPWRKTRGHPVIQPNEAWCKHGTPYAAAIRSASLSPTAKQIRLFTFPEDGIDPGFRHLSYWLRCEPAADAMLAEFGKEGCPVDPMAERLELVHHDGELLAALRRPAERIDADVVQDEVVAYVPIRKIHGCPASRPPPTWG